MNSRWQAVRVAMAEGFLRRIHWNLVLSFCAAMLLSAAPVLATGGDFTVDFAAAAPNSYNHATGGGEYGSGTVGANIVNSLQGGDFQADDVVSWLVLITVRSSASTDPQTIRLDFSFAATNTGHPGAAMRDVALVEVNPGDSANQGDGGSTTTYTRSNDGTTLRCSVTVDDLEPGEAVVVRIDTLLDRLPDSHPTGNLYGQLDGAEVTVPEGLGQDATISTGQQTVPFQRVAEIVNRPPSAVNDDATTPEDTAVAVPVLANDTDPDGDTLTVTQVSAPTNGTAVINVDGTVTYTPNAQFHGSDSFTYTVSDGQGGTATATVTVTVGSVNDPPVAVDDAASTAEDTAVTVTVLANDSDPDGDALTVTGVSTPPYGTTAVNVDNTVTYTPGANYNGSDSFTYTISDGNGGTATATVRVTIGGVNDPPVAVNDTATTNEDTPVAIDVLANDSDPDGDPLTIISVTDPAHGAAVINADKTVTYTPEANYNGSDSFNYTISDGGLTASATVTVTIGAVNDGPRAADDAATTNEDTPVAVDVLANDSDPDGDPLTVTGVSTPGHGAAVINPDQTITYTPAANHNGADSFTYTISDGNGGTATATVRVTVGAVNDAPVAVDDSAATDEDTAITINVLANDSDADGDSLTVTGVSTPGHGAAVINPDKTVTYTPAADYNGADSFTYTISDGNGGTATATVRITVNPANDPPVAANDSASTDEDVAVTIDVLANDSDVDGDTLIITEISPPGYGTAVTSAGGILYTPNANYNGSDSFTYTISDGQGGTASATVTVTVRPLNDPPVALDDSAGTKEDTAVIINVLANDSDVDGDTLTVTTVSTASNGTVALNVDGTVTYTPKSNFNGSDSFTYTISDGHETASATVTVTVGGVNDPPVAVNDSASTKQDVPVAVAVLANDSDVDGDTLTVTVVTNPGYGTAAINGDGTVTYTPASLFAGVDTFTYTISDGQGGTATATVTVQVIPVNNRSIQVNLKDRTLTHHSPPHITGSFTISNTSGGAYAVQVLAFSLKVEYRTSGSKKWTRVPDSAISNLLFSETPYFIIPGGESVTVTVDCDLAEGAVPDGAALRVTVGVQIASRDHGTHGGGWYYSSL